MGFTFRGFRFIINLSRRVIAGACAPEAGDVLWNREDRRYHLNRINNNVGEYRSHFIDFGWPGSPVNHFDPSMGRSSSRALPNVACSRRARVVDRTRREAIFKIF